MEHCTHTVQSDAASGTSTLTYLSSAGQQQTLNVGPEYVGSNRIFEDGQ
jgi:hypothetical protein